MAIFGFGSVWDGVEQKDNFFLNLNKEKEEGEITLGWNKKEADDLYTLISYMKVGDILYLKSSGAGSRTIRVKGIGIITHNLFDSIKGNKPIDDLKQNGCLSICVKWLYKGEFPIQIPDNDGKLTNVRAATAYEEYLPSVQGKILDKLFECINKQKQKEENV